MAGAGFDAWLCAVNLLPVIYDFFVCVCCITCISTGDDTLDTGVAQKITSPDLCTDLAVFGGAETPPCHSSALGKRMYGIGTPGRVRS